MNISIKEADTAKDFEAIKALLLEYGRMRKFDRALGDYEKEMNQLPGEYASPEGELLIAYVGDQAVGCVAYRKLDDVGVEMKRLFVRSVVNGYGIGKMLVDRLIAIAQQRGYQRMRLDTHPWMDAARHLYLKKGFKEIEAYNNNPTPGIRFFELKL